MQNSNFLYLGLVFHFRGLRKPLLKATVSFVMSIRLAVFLHGTGRFHRLSWICCLTFEIFTSNLSTYFSFV